MRRLSPLLALAAILLLTASAGAANPKLLAFGTGDVVLGADSATISNDAGEYGGVYINSRSLSSKLAGVTISFVSTGDVGGGAPRFSIPIDTDRNGTVEGYAFIDVNSCGSPLVSTSSATCMVYFHTEPAPYANWAAFAAAHPTWRIAPGAIPFIIADVPGNYAVKDIVLR